MPSEVAGVRLARKSEEKGTATVRFYYRADASSGGGAAFEHENSASAPPIVSSMRTARPELVSHFLN